MTLELERAKRVDGAIGARLGALEGASSASDRARLVERLKAGGVPHEDMRDEAHRFRQYLRSANLRRELRLVGVPDVVGAWCHTVGGCRLFNVVAIKQRYPGHACQAGHVASQCRAGAYLGRITVVVDEDIDITDLNEVMWAVCTRAEPRTFARHHPPGLEWPARSGNRARQEGLQQPPDHRCDQAMGVEGEVSTRHWPLA